VEAAQEAVVLAVPEAVTLHPEVVEAVHPQEDN